LTTEAVTYSDIENKAKYEASSVGGNVDTSATAKYNESGVTPNIGVPSSDKASSTPVHLQRFGEALDDMEEWMCKCKRVWTGTEKADKQ
jgi:hypothetical protein